MNCYDSGKRSTLFSVKDRHEQSHVPVKTWGDTILEVKKVQKEPKISDQTLVSDRGKINGTVPRSNRGY